MPKSCQGQLAEKRESTGCHPGVSASEDIRPVFKAVPDTYVRTCALSISV